jgi:hypothetical protein
MTSGRSEPQTAAWFDAGTSALPKLEPDSFQRCIQEMTLETLRDRRSLDQDKAKTVDTILSGCILQAPILPQGREQLDAWMTRAKHEVEALVDKTAGFAREQRTGRGARRRLLFFLPEN